MTTRTHGTFRELVAAMNRHDADAAAALLAEDVVFREPTHEKLRHGREAVRRDLVGFFAMLPDVRFATETLLVDGDRACHERGYRATYDGGPVALRERTFYRLDGAGRLAEVRVYFDRLALLRQLGLAPARMVSAGRG